MITVTYLGPLAVEDCEDENTWRLIGRFSVLVEGGNPDPIVYTVPEGFITDFASVPRLPVIYAWLGNRCHRAAVLHDWLYSEGEVDRELADMIFAAAMRTSGYPEAVIRVMYEGVRLGGDSRYNHKKAAGPKIDASPPTGAPVTVQWPSEVAAP